MGGSPLCLLVFFTPASVFTSWLLLYQLHLLLGIIAVIGHLFQSLLRHPLARPSLLAFGFVVVGSINDILLGNGIIESAFTAPYTVISFVMLQSAVIAWSLIRLATERDNLNTRVMSQTTRLVRELQSELRRNHNGQSPTTAGSAERRLRLEAESKVSISASVTTSAQLSPQGRRGEYE